MESGGNLHRPCGGGGGRRRAVFPKGPPRRLRETNRNELGVPVCLVLLFGMRGSNFYFAYFLFWLWSGRVDFEDGGDAPFAGFKTASELENVGGKNEDE